VRQAVLEAACLGVRKTRYRAQKPVDEVLERLGGGGQDITGGAGDFFKTWLIELGGCRDNRTGGFRQF
jgi:hypothetical protein